MSAMEGYGSATIGSGGMRFEVGVPCGEVVALYGFIGTMQALTMILSPDVAREIAADLASIADAVEKISASPDPSTESLPAAGEDFSSEAMP